MKRIAGVGFLFVVIMLWASCQKELSQESNVNNAVFSFHDTSNVCFPVTPNGTYYNGVSAARDTNFITVVVNITKTGDYNIITDSSNGFYFSASGFFSKTGLDTLVLQAGGTPILEQITPFTFPSDSLGACGFSIDVQDSTGTGLGGVDTSGGGGSSFEDTSYVDLSPATTNAWHFTDSITGTMYSGIFADSAVVSVEDDVSTLTVAGYTTDQSQVFGFDLDLPDGNIKTGVYQIIDSDNELGLINLDGTAVYDSDEDVASDGKSNSYITITSYDATTRQITGSFHCWAEDDNEDNFSLIKGSFNAFVAK